MKIQSTKASYPIGFKGLIKGRKTVPVDIIKNPTKEILEEHKIRREEQIKALGLMVIKEIKMSMQTKPEPPIK